jgi:cell division protein FtsW
VLWAAHVYANKDRRLGTLHQMHDAGGARLLLAIRLVVVGRDLGTALVLFAILLGMLWVVGRPAGCSRLDASSVVVALYLASTSPSGASRLTTSPTRSRTTTTRLAAGPRPLRAVDGGCSARASAPASRSGATCPRRTPTSSSPCSARSSAWSAPCSCRPVPHHRLRRDPGRAAHQRPVRPLHAFGIVVWLLGQMIINVGMVLALLPVIGIPLPLVSYGGSALLPSLVALGLLSASPAASPRPRAPWPAPQRRSRAPPASALADLG